MNEIVTRTESPIEAIREPWALSADAQMLQMLERLIRDPSVDAQRIEFALNMKRQMEQDSARKAFDAALSEAKAKIPTITKNRVVGYTSKRTAESTNYRYEDMGAIADVVNPILAENGLSYRYETKQDGGMLTVTCVLSHRDGYSTRTPLSAGADTSGQKNSIQAIASTVTYLQRYTLKAALGLAVSNDDDAATATQAQDDIISAEQVETLRRALAFVDGDEARFCKMIGVASLPDIFVSKFNDALKLIQSKGERK